jgi:hypothetical protein
MPCKGFYVLYVSVVPKNASVNRTGCISPLCCYFERLLKRVKKKFPRSLSEHQAVVTGVAPARPVLATVDIEFCISTESVHSWLSCMAGSEFVFVS